MKWMRHVFMHPEPGTAGAGTAAAGAGAAAAAGSAGAAAGAGQQTGIGNNGAAGGNGAGGDIQIAPADARKYFEGIVSDPKNLAGIPDPDIVKLYAK
ncbi:MAG TPA: hypothetical protein VE251_14670, partial [Xanthobacteraceae bacterium]|nr:hypothetical protein [Xanthobacteraceae bacterium]